LFEVILLGRGGQGVVTAGRILAEAALDTGYYAQSFPEFGPERSGAPVRTYVRISDQPLTLRAPMDQADHAIVFEARLLRTGIAGQVRGGGTLVVGSSSPPELDGGNLNIYYVDAAGIVEELGRPRSLNLAMLGASCSVTQIVPLETIARIVAARFGEKDADVVRLASRRVVMVKHAT
jgi:pyruvate ferredoxin oxidoreductase gamma subunit